MPVDRRRIADFLTEYGCEDARTALMPLEGLFNIAETGEYQLSPWETINPDTFKQGVALAIDKPVTMVAPFSLSQPFSKPDWMSSPIYMESVKIALMGSMGDSLRDSLRRNLGGSISNSLDVGICKDLSSNLHYNLWDRLKGTLEESSRLNIQTCLQFNLEVSIFFYLGFCILNDEERIQELKTLIELWSKCWMLGFKIDEPETLLIVCG